ncbi:hypothetical protein AB205_0127270 [Aquarana catesbeiana]|uniref:Uncharacterized protein n=1 Tax=Aquarana catesbeiana TaxID=8400 RepID=A0A2G9S8E1_AQUCT|nr:hypothetical protein AB205_0127270 [Aquarana catesbeiana]
MCFFTLLFLRLDEKNKLTEEMKIHGEQIGKDSQASEAAHNRNQMLLKDFQTSVKNLRRRVKDPDPSLANLELLTLACSIKVIVKAQPVLGICGRRASQMGTISTGKSSTTFWCKTKLQFKDKAKTFPDYGGSKEKESSSFWIRFKHLPKGFLSLRHELGNGVPVSRDGTLYQLQDMNSYVILGDGYILFFI